MDAAEPRESRPFEAGNQAEDPLLDRMDQLGLKSDHVEERAERVVLAQLRHRMGRPPVRGSVGPTGFMGPKRKVSRPRRAMTSSGRQPSKQGVSRPQSRKGTVSAASRASMNAP